MPSCEYDGNDRRKQCDMVVALNERHIASEQRFNDFLTHYEEDKEDSRIFRKEVRETLKSLSEDVSRMRPPVRAGIWIGIVALGSLITTAVGVGITKAIHKLIQ